MVAETHIKGLLFNPSIQQLIQQQQIKIILKSIPFRLKTYRQEIVAAKTEIKKLSLPRFNSMPSPLSKLFMSLGLNIVYKKLFLDRGALKNFMKKLGHRKEIFNLVDAHVNYVEEAYPIYGSYAVPKEKIFVTYNSPDTDYYFSVKEKILLQPPILPPNKFRLVHISRLTAWKRVDMLIEAVAHLKNRYPQIELLVIGQGPDMEQLKQQASQLGIGSSVLFLGGVYDAATLGKYLLSSSIYTLAGMGGLSINDAMIFGLPVICSVCDGTEKHLVKEGYNGLYFEDGNQKSLENKIAYLFDNPELCAKMGENSVQIIKEEINVHTVVARYLNAFRYVMKLKSSSQYLPILNHQEINRI
jgi:glycosyltransferase involved in cell wall biosynthesis